jgi:maleylpyruvate isomerase
MQPEEPGAGIAAALADMEMATRRLLVTAVLLTDAQVREPSRLPGWTRGHVLTHLARNADGCCNLLAWARTGTETPMYPSEAARDAAIAAGAGRSAAGIAADARDSAARLATAAARLPAGAWAATVARRGRAFPARELLAMRRSEVEIHHVDLGAGYQPDDWPPGFARAGLARVARDLAGRPDVPALLISPEGGAGFRIGPAAPAGGSDSPAGGSDSPAGGHAPQAGVSGPPGALLAWLTGRGDGTGLQVTGAAALPVLPPWR